MAQGPMQLHRLKAGPGLAVDITLETFITLT